MATILENIRAGKYDNSLDRIIAACRERQADRMWDLQPGDKVRFNNDVRPTSLRGRTATIVEFRRSRILVNLDSPITRSRRGARAQFFGATREVTQFLVHTGSISPVKSDV